LAKFSILQSGLQSSFIDYKKILSTEIYSELVKTILNRFKSNPAISTEQVWRNFHKNNWSNRSIVPKAPAWTKIENGVMKIGSSSSLLANDFMVKYILNPKYTREQLKKMKKNKSIVEAYQPILFEKTDEVDKKKRVIYVPIGKLGNGSRMLEIYDDERESILPGNVMQMEAKAALTKAEGYTSAAELMKQPAFIKAKEEIKAEKSKNNMLKNLADTSIKNIKAAKKVCSNCPLTIKCLEYALNNGPIQGVWGGLTEKERYNLVRNKRMKAQKLTS
jgi:WhiB family redox-sensing transcriptional regulator